MPVDVEMNDSAAPAPAVIPAIADVPAPAPALSTLQHLKEIASVIEAGSLTKEVRRISRAVRLTVALRRRLAPRDVAAFLAFALPSSSDAFAHLSPVLPKEDGSEMDVDIVAPVAQVSIKHGLTEIEIYCYLLVLIFLIDHKKYNEAKACANASIARLKNLNRRTVDVLASRLYSYYSYAHELTNSLAELRGMATLHRDELGQETLLNLLLRNYLHYNLSDQAEKLRLKAPRFEAHSNQQFCRYLVYLGKIRTIRLEYTDAKESLLQAARKAPTAVDSAFSATNGL
ncbi:hypothetical protein QYE76_023012 [Lolium multiflorum]|uniref:26S proteasome non-ATPase regulatory subunit 3 N-terminal TPR repeats domain-containing protein n=1 Tax=Lolium multiflorum TaxID=4521 RepID=A0AAD8VLS7_LOLMU|nr:hypothetical protein QYE76_036080 [Lolium multiflorum]KAK1617495.1 hypothetical protein QYE76_023012 [Lolium multiflorum]